MGIIGATEYVQDNKKLLQERAVAYINMDNLVHGNDSIKATGNPMTMDLVYTQSMMVPDPHGPQESIYSVWRRSRPDLNGKDRPQFHTVGFGSDYIPFYEMAGKIVRDSNKSRFILIPHNAIHHLCYCVELSVGLYVKLKVFTLRLI